MQHEPDCYESYKDHWDALRKFSKCLTEYSLMQDQYKLSQFSPYVNISTTCEHFDTSTNTTISKQLLGPDIIMIEPLEVEVEPPFHDDIPDMPWYWYWRDKEFTRTHN